MTTRQSNAPHGVQWLRDLADDYGDRASKASQRAEVLIATANVHRRTRAELMAEADKLEAIALPTASEPELFERLGKAMGMDGGLTLVWVPGVGWELREGAVPRHIFTPGDKAVGTSETTVPWLPFGTNERAALLAILAVVE